MRTVHCCRIDGSFIKEIARAHYESRYNPPRKAFDFYSAMALGRFMKSSVIMSTLPERQLFYSDKYGLTLVSKNDMWETTLQSYVSRIDTVMVASDSDFIKTKKEYFQREISIMQTIEILPKLKVVAL